MKKNLSDKVQYLFQAGTAVLNNVGQAEQSPFLARVFDPNNVSLAQFFNTLFKTAIVVGAMLAVMRLGYAGFIYMTTDLPGSKSSARSVISQAVLGLLLLLSVWIILNQINPQILNLNILQNVQSSSPGGSTQQSGGSNTQQFNQVLPNGETNSFFGAP